MIIKLIRDEAGFVVSTELILISTILVIGVIVGQTTMRDQVVTEFGDAADAISALDHSYMYAEYNVATHGSVAGVTFSDTGDFCDSSDSGQQGLASTEGTCILIDTADGLTGNQAAGVQGTVGGTAN